MNTIFTSILQRSRMLNRTRNRKNKYIIEPLKRRWYQRSQLDYPYNVEKSIDVIREVVNSNFTYDEDERINNYLISKDAFEIYNLSKQVNCILRNSLVPEPRGVLAYNYVNFGKTWREFGWKLLSKLYLYTYPELRMYSKKDLVRGMIHNLSEKEITDQLCKHGDVILEFLGIYKHWRLKNLGTILFKDFEEKMRLAHKKSISILTYECTDSNGFYLKQNCKIVYKGIAHFSDHTSEPYYILQKLL